MLLNLFFHILSERKVFEQSVKMTLHVRCQTDISPLLTMSQPTIVDILPKLPKLSLKQIKNISINPLEPEKPTPQPSQFNQLTLKNFVKCETNLRVTKDRKLKMKNKTVNVIQWISKEG